MRAGDQSIERLRAAIEEIAADDVRELLAEARAEARSRVRSMLTEAMAQAMLERAQVELSGEGAGVRPRASPVSERPRPEARRGQERRQPESAPVPRPGPLGWYIYCVTRADGPALPDLPGVEPEHPVAPLREGGLTAIVSRVPLAEFEEEPLRDHLGDMGWVERMARRHEEVLDIVRGLRTVVPMRLCTVYRDEVGVRAMLDREAQALSDTLAGFDGRVEWGVKVFAPDAETEARIDAEGQGAPAAGDLGTPDVRDRGTGAAYLAGRVRERHAREEIGARYDEACRSIHERLSGVAADSLVSAPQRREVSDRDMVFNGVYLVDEHRQEVFDGELARLRAEYASLGLELEPTGPWPAYNFVPPTIGATA